MSKKERFSRRLPSPATLIAIVAMFALLGGTATAASGLINGKKIKKGTVTGKQIKNKSLALNKLKPAAVKKLQGATGPRGAQGPAGAKGEAGPQGPAGIVAPITGSDTNEELANNAETTVLTVGVPKAGTYVINAKTNLFALQDTSRVECHLYANETSVDMVQWTASEPNARVPVSLLAVADAAPGGPIRVKCKFTDGNGSAFDTKVVAIPVG